MRCSYVSFDNNCLYISQICNLFIELNEVEGITALSLIYKILINKIFLVLVIYSTYRSGFPNIFVVMYPLASFHVLMYPLEINYNKTAKLYRFFQSKDNYNYTLNIPYNCKSSFPINVTKKNTYTNSNINESIVFQELNKI